MKILFTICGRAGSTGIKNKNIRDFLGKPLPLYTLSAIDLLLKRHAEISGEIVVNSDSERLLNIFERNTIRNTRQFSRNKELSGGSVSKFLVVRDCLARMNEIANETFDMVVDLDITSPLRTVKNIESLISEKKTSKSDVVFSVTNARRNPFFNMVRKGQNGYERVVTSDLVTRQAAPEVFDMNASLYAYDPSFVMLGDGLFNGRCGIVKMFDTGILDLDHESDFELMEVIARHLFQTKKEYAEVRDNIDSSGGK
jgi:CMP-N,N'-diacetyllegionaminic acid synthase